MGYMICQDSRTSAAIHPVGSVIWRAGGYSAPIGWKNWAHLKVISTGNLAIGRQAREIVGENSNSVSITNIKRVFLTVEGPKKK